MFPIKTETIRILDSITKLNPPMNEEKIQALIVVAHGGMRFQWDGSDPTKTNAMVVRRGDTVKLDNIFEIKLMQMIHDSRYCNCWINVTYFKEE